MALYPILISHASIAKNVSALESVGIRKHNPAARRHQAKKCGSGIDAPDELTALLDMRRLNADMDHLQHFLMMPKCPIVHLCIYHDGLGMAWQVDHLEFDVNSTPRSPWA